MAFIHSKDLLFFFMYGVGGSLNRVGKVKGSSFFLMVLWVGGIGGSTPFGQPCIWHVLCGFYMA